MSAQETLPPGWRKPTVKESSEDWRGRSPNRFLAVSADFDGDAATDVAELLVNRSSKQVALFVLLAAMGKWQQNRNLGVNGLEFVGIDLVNPGSYQTACGKGYGEEVCSHGEPQQLKLSKPAIDLFFEGKADLVLYWDGRIKKFVEVQMSD